MRAGQVKTMINDNLQVPLSLAPFADAEGAKYYPVVGSEISEGIVTTQYFEPQLLLTTNTAVFATQNFLLAKYDVLLVNKDPSFTEIHLLDIYTKVIVNDTSLFLHFGSTNKLSAYDINTGILLWNIVVPSNLEISCCTSLNLCVRWYVSPNYIFVAYSTLNGAERWRRTTTGANFGGYAPPLKIIGGNDKNMVEIVWSTSTSMTLHHVDPITGIRGESICNVAYPTNETASCSIAATKNRCFFKTQDSQSNFYIIDFEAKAAYSFASGRGTRQVVCITENYIYTAHYVQTTENTTPAIARIEDSLYRFRVRDNGTPTKVGAVYSINYGGSIYTSSNFKANDTIEYNVNGITALSSSVKLRQFDTGARAILGVKKVEV